MVAGSKAAEELEYKQFVEQTGFDYRHDLDAVAAAFQDDQTFFVLRGRFRWKNLMEYAQRQGGSCHDNYCVAAGSKPDRRISFHPIESNLMAMAISRDDFAAYQITRQKEKFSFVPPNVPLWAVIPSAALAKSGLLPAGTKAYVSALQKADQAVFTVGPDGDHLRLAVHVTCRDAAAASTLVAQFESTTNTLRKWIEREHQQPNPADLSGILVAGTFRREDRQVHGQWPIPRAFVDAVGAGSF